jgi:hypothetical protein
MVMLQPVDISSGLVSGVEDLSAAASAVVNWETDEAGIGRPRPGLATHAVTSAGDYPSIGLVRWKSYLINVTSDRYVRVLYDTAPGAFQVVSTSDATTQIPGVAPRVTFALGDEYIYIAGGGQIVRWKPATTPEVLSQSPSQVTHIAILGQRLIANDKTQASAFFWSEAGEGAWTSWPSANAANAESRPDPIVALAENTSELFVWGAETLQVYAVGVDPTLPFDPIATTNIGLAAPYAFTRMGVEPGFAWLDNDTRIVIGDGRSATPVSDAIQRTLKRLTTISDCWMYREVRGQQASLVVRIPTERRTFVYDLKGSKWMGERNYYDAPFNTADWPVSAYAYWPPFKYHMFGSSMASVGLLRFDEDSRLDIAAPIVSERVTGWQDFGTRNAKRAGRLRVTMRRGLGTQGGTPGALEVRVQDDDKAWSTWKQLSLGAPEDYKQYADTYGTAGIFRRRRYGIRYSNTESASVAAVHDDVDDLEAA